MNDKKITGKSPSIGNVSGGATPPNFFQKGAPPSKMPPKTPPKKG